MSERQPSFINASKFSSTPTFDGLPIQPAPRWEQIIVADPSMKGKLKSSASNILWKIHPNKGEYHIESPHKVVSVPIYPGMSIDKNVSESVSAEAKEFGGSSDQDTNDVTDVAATVDQSSAQGSTNLESIGETQTAATASSVELPDADEKEIQTEGHADDKSFKNNHTGIKPDVSNKGRVVEIATGAGQENVHRVVIPYSSDSSRLSEVKNTLKKAAALGEAVTQKIAAQAKTAVEATTGFTHQVDLTGAVNQGIQVIESTLNAIKKTAAEQTARLQSQTEDNRVEGNDLTPVQPQHIAGQAEQHPDKEETAQSNPTKPKDEEADLQALPNQVEQSNGVEAGEAGKINNIGVEKKPKKKVKNNVTTKKPSKDPAAEPEQASAPSVAAEAKKKATKNKADEEIETKETNSNGDVKPAVLEKLDEEQLRKFYDLVSIMPETQKPDFYRWLKELEVHYNYSGPTIDLSQRNENQPTADTNGSKKTEPDKTSAPEPPQVAQEIQPVQLQPPAPSASKEQIPEEPSHIEAQPAQVDNPDQFSPSKGAFIAAATSYASLPIEHQGDSQITDKSKQLASVTGSMEGASSAVAQHEDTFTFIATPLSGLEPGKKRRVSLNKPVVGIRIKEDQVTTPVAAASVFRAQQGKISITDGSDITQDGTKGFVSEQVRNAAINSKLELLKEQFFKPKRRGLFGSDLLYIKKALKKIPDYKSHLILYPEGTVTSSEILILPVGTLLVEKSDGYVEVNEIVPFINGGKQKIVRARVENNTETQVNAAAAAALLAVGIAGLLALNTYQENFQKPPDTKPVPGVLDSKPDLSPNKPEDSTVSQKTYLPQISRNQLNEGSSSPSSGLISETRNTQQPESPLVADAAVSNSTNPELGKQKTEGSESLRDTIARRKAALYAKMMELERRIAQWRLFQPEVTQTDPVTPVDLTFNFELPPLPEVPPVTVENSEKFENIEAPVVPVESAAPDSSNTEPADVTSEIQFPSCDTHFEGVRDSSGGIIDGTLGNPENPLTYNGRLIRWGRNFLRHTQVPEGYIVDTEKLKCLLTDYELLRVKGIASERLPHDQWNVLAKIWHKANGTLPGDTKLTEEELIASGIIYQQSANIESNGVVYNITW